MDTKLCKNCEVVMDTIWERSGFVRKRGNDVIYEMNTSYKFANWKCPRCGELRIPKD